MTTARFDPRNLTLYDKAPPLLHLEFGDGRVYRYARIESFAPGVLNEDSRRTPEEDARHETHEEILARLIK
jgi:hypothetical protein